MNELIWAAGLFIGEGTVIVVSRPPRGNLQERHYLTMALAMADERAVRRFYDALQPFVEYTRRVPPAQVYTIQPKRPHALLAYRYALTSTPAISVCRALYPHMAHTDKGDQTMRCFIKLGLTLS